MNAIRATEARTLKIMAKSFVIQIVWTNEGMNKLQAILHHSECIVLESKFTGKHNYTTRTHHAHRQQQWNHKATFISDSGFHTREKGKVVKGTTAAAASTILLS